MTSVHGNPPEFSERPDAIVGPAEARLFPRVFMDQRSFAGTLTVPAKGQAIGRVISNRAPPAGWLDAAIVPPCRSTIAFTIDRPRPLPPDALRDASAL